MIVVHGAVQGGSAAARAQQVTENQEAPSRWRAGILFSAGQSNWHQCLVFPLPMSTEVEAHGAGKWVFLPVPDSRAA